MKLQIGIELADHSWDTATVELPFDVPFTPAFARAALNHVEPGALRGIVWNGLFGYRLYFASWKKVGRFKTGGAVYDFIDYSIFQRARNAGEWPGVRKGLK